MPRPDAKYFATTTRNDSSEELVGNRRETQGSIAAHESTRNGSQGSFATIHSDDLSD